MSGGSSANNSWTILTPEENVAETLRPLAEGTEHHGEILTSAEGSGENQPASGAESAEGLPVEGHLVSDDKTAELSGDTSTEQHTSEPAAVTDAPVPTSLEVSGSDALSQSEGLPEGPAQTTPDPDSFSDSYTHITPSPDEPPATQLTTETLGGLEFTQEEETLTQEGTQHSLNGEGLHQDGEELDLSSRTCDVGKQADSPVDSEVGEERTEKTGEEGESEVRRRSLLAALERVERTEEEEEVEEEFQLPQREDDSGFSVNKCILGAVILLGLGTIFFSESDYGTRELNDAELPGKQEWLNPEIPPPPVDADNTELLNNLAKGNEQISVLQAQLQTQKEELKVAKGQAAEGAKERFQWEEVEKENTNEAAQAAVKPPTSPSSGQPEDSTQGTAGSTERQPMKSWDDQREKKKDMKKEKKDMGENKEGKEKEKEGEKKQRKDGGKSEWKKGKHEQGKSDKEKDKEEKQRRQSGETKQWKEKDWKKEKASRGDEGKPWKDREGKKEWIEKSERKELKEEKGWKRAKHEKENEGKQWRGKEEKKDWKVGKEHGEKHKGREDGEWKGERGWKKGKDGYKESGKEKWEKKDWKEKGEKKEWKKDSDWKSKNGKDHSKEGKGKGERKQWEESKNHGKDRKGKDERKPWKSENGKDDKDWKRKDERKQWKSENGKDDKDWKRKDERKQWKSENGKDDKDWKRKDERKQWKSENGKDDKDWKRKDERKQKEKEEEQWKRGGQKEKKQNGDWNKDRSSAQKHEDEHKCTSNHGHKEEHLWGDRKTPHTHRRPSMEQPEYWVQQRDRLQHKPKPPQNCNSLESCAQAEGLLPVSFPEFEVILQTYLAKAEGMGVDASVREELKKLATQFFKDGLFVHDQMSFQDFAEDLEDVLEDMVEGDENEEEGSAREEEMEGFEEEVMKKFSLPGAGEKEEKSKGERKKESGRGRG